MLENSTHQSRDNNFQRIKALPVLTIAKEQEKEQKVKPVRLNNKTIVYRKC